ncbi:MAG: FAD-binding oxidoreductase [Woeseiaceae bacterium]|nr:FAD-binding oxidoreductase [Woeseiaceae bacterium]
MDSLTELASIVDGKRLLPPDAVAKRATSYWNSAPMQARALVMPSTTDEVAGILRACNDAGQSLITQGGLTNCVEAVEPTNSDVVLSTEKMAGIVEIDHVGGTAVVEAGAVLQTVQETVAAEGLYFPLDLGARGSCTIGGNIATNAGGINVLKYGMMRNLVLGLETVLADGTVVSSMNRMLKNNAGYDTKQLFIGSEGSLGIVTRAVLRLFPLPHSRQDALVGLTSFDNVVALLARLKSELTGSLSAFEIMWNDYYAAVTDEGWHRAPLARDYPYYVVFQAEGSDPDVDDARFGRVLEAALEEGIIVDAVLPKSEAEIRAVWSIREDFDALMQMEPLYLYDVSLPIRDMQDYVDEVYRLVEQRFPQGKAWTLGHIADGNLHFFIWPGKEGDYYDAVNACVYDPLQQYGGSVSAEHGIGIGKLKWLPHSRSQADIELMRTLKQSLDPKGILNPDRVIPHQ